MVPELLLTAFDNDVDCCADCCAAVQTPESDAALAECNRIAALNRPISEAEYRGLVSVVRPTLLKRDVAIAFCTAVWRSCRTVEGNRVPAGKATMETVIECLELLAAELSVVSQAVFALYHVMESNSALIARHFMNLDGLRAVTLVCGRHAETSDIWSYAFGIMEKLTWMDDGIASLIECDAVPGILAAMDKHVGSDDAQLQWVACAALKGMCRLEMGKEAVMAAGAESRARRAMILYPDNSRVMQYCDFIPSEGTLEVCITVYFV